MKTADRVAAYSAWAEKPITRGTIVLCVVLYLGYVTVADHFTLRNVVSVLEGRVTTRPVDLPAPSSTTSTTSTSSTTLPNYMR